MINIERAFSTENKSVFEYFQRPGVGFYIPLYQREYSWDDDNIEQFLEDIARGVENLLENEENEIRFLGTIITVTETDKKQIEPQDGRALPTSIEKVIDGQQRLSTISLCSTLIHYYIGETTDKLVKSISKLKMDNAQKTSLETELNQIRDFWQAKLKEIFAIDLKRGKPTLKPKIIRGNQDRWVFEESTNTSYLSDVSEHLFNYIEFVESKKEFKPKFDKETKAGRNLSLFNDWINKKVLAAHINH